MYYLLVVVFITSLVYEESVLVWAVNTHSIEYVHNTDIGSTNFQVRDRVQI